MQTAELQFVLRNCFDVDELRRIQRTVSPSEDPYEAAVEAILNEDEDGLSVLDELDRSSLKQRRKVRSMSARELRSGVAFEFMERGRTLALTVWALMRDDRIAAKTMADSLVQQFSLQSTTPIESDEGVVNEAIEVNELLLDLAAPDPEPEIDLTHLLHEEDEAKTAVPEKTAQDVISEEEITREVDSLIDSLQQDTPIEIIEEDDDDDDIVLDPLSLEDDIDAAEEFLDSADLIEIEDLEEDDDVQIEFMGEAASSEDDVIRTLEDVDSLIASFQDEEEQPAEELDEITLAADNPVVEFDQSVSVELGGVPIPLSALQQACERVFQEPVELVIDETLTRDDKIVVVGKQCGVRVLQGPSCAISAPDEDFVPSDAPVIVSPESLQSALSTIYGESVEIVPDVRLLSRGVVVFAGKSIGIGMYEHPRMQVLTDESGAVEQAASSQEAAELSAKIQHLEERLSALEGGAATVARPQDPTAPVAEPQPEPEPEESLSNEAISLDEIETEELSPVTEDISEDDLMAAIALQDDDEEDDDAGLTDLGVVEDEPAGDALDMEAIEDLVGDDSGAKEESNEEEFAFDAGEDKLDLDGLDLGEIGLDDDSESDGLDLADLADEAVETDEAAAEDDLDFEDLDLDSLGDDSLTEEALSDLGLGEETEAETAEDTPAVPKLDDGALGDLDLDLGDFDSDDSEEDSSIGDALDLDVLSELDDGGDEITPHKVFNGEKILILGGEADHSEDYQRVVQEVGGAAEWHGELNGMGAEEIAELVDQCDLILTLSGDALSDPGILQAVNYAQENNKRLFEHHSANPVSVQKQLVKLVEDGKV